MSTTFDAIFSSAYRAAAPWSFDKSRGPRICYSYDTDWQDRADAAGIVIRPSSGIPTWFEEPIEEPPPPTERA